VDAETGTGLTLRLKLSEIASAAFSLLTALR
jgi:hypothetical protein